MLKKRNSSPVGNYRPTAIVNNFSKFFIFIILWHIYAMQEFNIETRSHNYATVDEVVFSLCRAEPCIASNRLALSVARQQL
jgi:hypothetical protein